MASDSVSRSLDSFFTSDDRVLVIKGAWGVGKTYLWNTYIQAKIDAGSLSQLAYSYVSLFGKSSLADIRASVFQNAKPVSSAEKIERNFDDALASSTSLLKSVPWVRATSDRARGNAPLLGWLTKLARSTPFTDKYVGIIASLEYGLVKNYVVCFDDLERKGGTLSIREVMGLVDELAQRKDCKIVLIFNDNSFSEDKDKYEFEAYREKVVDAEITYAPTHAENLERAVARTDPLFAKVERAVVALDLKNIRVLKKVRRLCDLFWPELKDCDDLIATEFANHATVLCWSFYMRGTALEFGFVRSRLEESSWASYFLGKEEELPADEKRYREISSAVDLSPSVFDDHIIHFLLHGYVDAAELRSVVADLSKKVDTRRAQRELNGAWNLYTNSFANNQAEIVSALRAALTKDFDKFSVSEFAGALEMLSDFGEDVASLVETYVASHAAELASMDQHDTFLTRRVTFKPLLERIRTVQAPRTNLDIDQVAMRIAVQRGWNPEDIDFLASLSSDDLCNWMRGNPPDLPTKIRSGLLFFRDLQGGGAEESRKYSQIYERTKTALVQLGAESPLNKKRIQHLYEIGEEA
jgi:hypothetical protein